MQLNFIDFDPAYEQQVVSAPSKKKRLPSMSYAPEELDLPDELPQGKSPGAFKTISEASALMDVPQHVLRFWESRFPQIKPLKLRGGRRYYRPEDIDILSTIKNLLYKEGYTIDGAKKALGGKQEGARSQARKTALSDKQHSQLSVIRHELIGLRDVLKQFVY